ncbi:MAG: hypothetical protein DWQ09_01875 [Proteobacteria bacterium]|nr:MAG: hypothetical protein DWQ09_01875 [Pseudomonadota bacterium]QKK10322.1 MAG: hypothetical protein HND59_00550 [Pseudomonadota bacterium]
MFSDQMTKVAIGLAFIIPLIFLVRWLLTRVAGSPDQWAEEHIEMLKQRREKGEIDEATYQRLLEDLTRD